MEEMINKLVRAVVQNGAKKIFLQLPEGLKIRTAEIAEALDKAGVQCIASAEPCYGACDLRDKEAEMLGCDLLVHVGHNKFYKDIKTCLPVFYFPWPFVVKKDVMKEILEKEAKKIKERRIGLVTTVQHLFSLEDAADTLKGLGKEPVIGGQILGCWTQNAKNIDEQVDCFLFIGSGVFHPLAIKTKKSVYMLDLEKHEITDLTQERLSAEKKRMARIEKAKQAGTFGILVSTKPGQLASEDAIEKIKKLLKSKNKKSLVIEMNNITGEKLLGIRVDAFINTACPRVVENIFEKPVINIGELNML